MVVVLARLGAERSQLGKVVLGYPPLPGILERSAMVVRLK